MSRHVLLPCLACDTTQRIQHPRVGRRARVRARFESSACTGLAWHAARPRSSSSGGDGTTCAVCPGGVLAFRSSEAPLRPRLACKHRQLRLQLRARSEAGSADLMARGPRNREAERERGAPISDISAAAVPAAPLAALASSAVAQWCKGVSERLCAHSHMQASLL